MCGIAGIMYKNGGDENFTGRALIDMLDGCQHRGPDSTGFALYGETRPGQLRLRFLVGEGEDASDSIARIKGALAKHGPTSSRISASPTTTASPSISTATCRSSPTTSSTRPR